MAAKNSALAQSPLRLILSDFVGDKREIPNIRLVVDNAATPTEDLLNRALRASSANVRNEVSRQRETTDGISASIIRRRKKQLPPNFSNDALLAIIQRKSRRCNVPKDGEIVPPADEEHKETRWNPSPNTQKASLTMPVRQVLIKTCRPDIPIKTSSFDSRVAKAEISPRSRSLSSRPGRKLQKPCVLDPRG